MLNKTKKSIRGLTLISALYMVLHIGGFLTSIEAVMNTRTPQGAIAWAISLNTMPSVALPAYWIFGRSEFNGYVKAFQVNESQLNHYVQKIEKTKFEFHSDKREQSAAILAGEKLTSLPVLNGNDVELLINGEETFNSIFAGIEKAEKYVLVQFFIIKNDKLGRELQRRLINKAQEGVAVYFIYDEVGSYALGRAYLDEMRAAGIKAVNFHSRKGPKNRFQVNFRNHRKIVIVDGRACWTGGHNVGDEYLGQGKKFTHWRDTHMKFKGPAVLPAQLSFLEDYHWATDEVIDLDWKSALNEEGNAPILIIPSGPADELETAGLMFHHAINSARERIWIASPYFVPDNAIVSALELAALRGVDVRILIPDEPDHYTVYLAAFSFIDKLKHFENITFYRYTKGFMHQKTMLIDKRTAAVGTANFDNRSFRLNFELTALVLEKEFASEVEEMFLEDFSNSRRVEKGELENKPFWFRLLVKTARLTSPIL